MGKDHVFGGRNCRNPSGTIDIFVDAHKVVGCNKDSSERCAPLAWRAENKQTSSKLLKKGNRWL
jgi:hypothetical protein